MRGLLVVVLVALVAAAFFWMRAVPPAPPATVVVTNTTPTPTTSTEKSPPAVSEKISDAKTTPPTPASPTFVEFASNEMTDKMVLEVGRMVRPNRVIASIEKTESGRVGFVVVDGDQHIYDIEGDLLPQYEKALVELGLKPAEGISTRVLSRYRSVSKTAMKFDELRDRMLVIVMPSAEWTKLRLPKPAAWPKDVPIRPEN